MAGGWASSALFGGTLAERLAGIGDEVAGGGGRAAIYALALRLIGERPWLGYGYGTFERIFTMAREPEFHVVYDHAESSWLELVVDLGLPIAALFALAMLLLAAMLLRGALRRRRDRVLPLTALAVAVAAGVHAMVDFSLQIPAVAVTFAAIAATGAAHVVPLRHMPPAGSVAIWSTARIAAVLLGALLLVLAVPYARATWHLAVGNSAFRLVAADEPVLPAVVERARGSREAALAIHPTGRTWKELGMVELYRARDPGLSWEQRQEALQRARAHLRSGLARDPADPAAWYRLALVETMRGRIEDAADALALSWRTGPWEPELAPARLRLALLHWPHLTEEARRRAGREFCADPERAEQLRTWIAEAGLAADPAVALSVIECATQ
ncbi:hypothetical protein HRbin39_00293 [bacterium HR39]|nr:hypothetical protein HRbin39_00293 [bacterium HR39]